MQRIRLFALNFSSRFPLLCRVVFRVLVSFSVFRWCCCCCCSPSRFFLLHFLQLLGSCCCYSVFLDFWFDVFVVAPPQHHNPRPLAAFPEFSGLFPTTLPACPFYRYILSQRQWVLSMLSRSHSHTSCRLPESATCSPCCCFCYCCSSVAIRVPWLLLYLLLWLWWSSRRDLCTNPHSLHAYGRVCSVLFCSDRCLLNSTTLAQTRVEI